MFTGKNYFKFSLTRWFVPPCSWLTKYLMYINLCKLFPVYVSGFGKRRSTIFRPYPLDLFQVALTWKKKKKFTQQHLHFRTRADLKLWSLFEWGLLCLLYSLCHMIQRPWRCSCPCSYSYHSEGQKLELQAAGHTQFGPQSWYFPMWSSTSEAVRLMLNYKHAVLCVAGSTLVEIP